MSFLSPDVTGLLILALCVFLFLTKFLPTAVTGFMGCLLMVLCGVCKYEQAFSGYSSSIVMLMASAMIVGIAMFKTGIAHIIGTAATRWSHGSEHAFLMASCVIGGLLSMFFANTAIIAAYLPIIESTCRARGGMSRLNLVLPVSLAVMVGGTGTLVGCTPQLTANALMLHLSGKEMSMWTLTAPVMCIFAIYLTYTYFLALPVGKRIWGERAEREMDIDRAHLEKASEPIKDKKKLFIMTAILAAMILSYVLGVLPPAYTAMIACILCVATGCCSPEDIKREFHFETVVFLASCLGIAEALTAAKSGDLIGHLVAAALGEVGSPMLSFAAIVFLTVFLSQFITNSTAIIISLPIGLSLCDVYGMNHVAFCVGVTIAASVACCTPLAAAQIAMTQVAGYGFSDYVKYCALPSLIMYIGILVFVPLFFPLV